MRRTRRAARHLDDKHRGERLDAMQEDHVLYALMNLGKVKPAVKLHA